MSIDQPTLRSRRAAIVAVGDELLLGQQLDTNSGWLGQSLSELGWTVVAMRTVGDDREAIASTIRELSETCAVLVITGGLGPTLDDLTREALGDVVDPGEELVEDPAGARHLHDWFGRRGRTPSASNLRQALRPPSARLLPNAFGTAPGLAVERRGPQAADDTECCRIFCLPGPPREMEPMFHACVAPIVRDAATRAVITETVSQIGLGEAPAADRLGALMERSRLAAGLPLVGTTASGGIVRARIRMECPADERARGQSLVEDVAQRVEQAWHPYAYGRGGGSLVEAVVALLRSRTLTLAVAESCTGGLLGSLIVDLPGVSDCFLGGFLTYSNELKSSLLGVPARTLGAHGAVSEQTARAMSDRCIARTGAGCAIAVTGVAGPDGGSDEKPVGTVYIGVATPVTGAGAAHTTRVRRFLVTGSRRDVRERSAMLALQALRLQLLGHGQAPLLWEVEA